MVHATGRALILESRAHLVSKYEVVYTSDPPVMMIEYSYLERSIAGWHVFGGREAVDASSIVRFS
jgi:hypothetical protein